MKKEEIQLWDWQRILLGQAPWEFIIEVFIRTVIIYLILLIAMRLFGKRMNANISVFELAVVITLGAIVSLPMQSPDRGLLQGVILLACIVIFQRGLSYLTYRYKKVEKITQGDVSALVENGKINVEELRKARLSHEQLYQHLRAEEIRHLGQVKRVYLEACGHFSVFRNPEPKPGLCIIPARDEELYKEVPRNHMLAACKNCGYVKEIHTKSTEPCRNCGAEDWDQAVNEKAEEFELTQ